MKILVVGDRGYCGSGIVAALRLHGCQVVGFDLAPARQETGDPGYVEIQGDLNNPEELYQAAEGCQAVVGAFVFRMNSPIPLDSQLSRSEKPIPFDLTHILTYQVNAVGTLNMLEVARQRGLKQAVLLSSSRLIWDHFVNRDGSTVYPGFQVNAFTPLKFSDMYGLSKFIQEQVAEYYAAEFGLSMTVFRPWWVVDGPANTNRMGKPLEEDTIPLSPAGMVDRTDLGEACYLALQHPEIRYAVFYPLAGPHCDHYFDVATLRETLGWHPVYTFDHLAGAKHGLS